MTFWYFFWRALLKGLFGFFCEIHVLRRELSGLPGGRILAANHISHFDPPILSVVSRRQIDWMAMEELFRLPVLGGLLGTVGAFPVRRGKPDRVALRMAVRRLEEGRVVGIFPEGGIRDGKNSVLEGGGMRPGVALVAAMAGVEIQPVVILGSDRLYNRRNWVPGRRTPIWVGFGEPFGMEEDSGSGRERFEMELVVALRQLRDELREFFCLRVEDMPHAPRERMAGL
ncbi:MAG: 1-acyl-sn-glycerol-3-phosphate acyltransferase [Chthoniobacterales bacterium]|nr:1-acyl-sn-glycerol-3-phosphate acyltransferase [Chthoniobacterales bacterium]